jgi:hypothetical protein
MSLIGTGSTDIEGLSLETIRDWFGCGCAILRVSSPQQERGVFMRPFDLVDVLREAEIEPTIQLGRSV